jgi:RNase P/RNase MRP subunit POP5
LEIDSTETFDSKEFMDAIWNAITRLYGEYGASRTGLTMIDYRTEEKLAVIRVTLPAIDMVRAAIASVTKIGNRHVVVHVLSVSGTLKALQKNLGRQ